MQESLFENYVDYSSKKVLIGLSGGINSMAVLCQLASYPNEYKPKELHLFYAHFEEHSDDTLDFVFAGVEYAKSKFNNVTYKQTNNSVIDFFRQQKMIPHPIISPCTKMLKIIPMAEYAKQNSIDIDLVGYVRDEVRRIKNMWDKNPNTKNTKAFPIADKDNQWCFDIVKKEIGFYPSIYDIKNSKGDRVFTHNNCLPCKNWNKNNFANGNKYYPHKMTKAIELQNELQQHWGRNADDIYSRWEKQDWESNGQSCEYCAFD
jgi:3'-phosphoadenosine 5'-phosphosulfate sulfotransferase (PAPS reductase)/FAD synthetase